MTEAEWLAAANPLKPLMYARRTAPTLRTVAGQRKFRLFAVGCARRIWPAVRQVAQQRAVEVVEQFADGSGPRGGMWNAWTAARQSFPGTDPTPLIEVLFALCGGTAWDAAKVWRLTSAAAFDPVRGNKAVEEKQQLAALVRCIFGNPFRPVTFEPAWRTSDVLALAKGIYDDRAFDRLPILADALQDAGCACDDILAHCRSDGPHARGCWAVDLVLGKA